MPTLTESEQNTVKILLGYSAEPNILTTELSEPHSAEKIALIQSIIAELTDPTTGIDGQLKAARTDSMAMAVGNLRLSYSQHVAHLKSEGTRYLQELSNVLGVPILFNKYRTKKSMVRYW